MLALASAVVLSLVAAGCAPDEHVEIDVPAQVGKAFPEATAQQLQDAVTHAMAAAGASGAIVGVWAPWSGTLVTGLGVESPGSTEAVSEDMEFRVAQLTRPMTCDVLYAVAAEGTVRLDGLGREMGAGRSRSHRCHARTALRQHLGNRLVPSAALRTLPLEPIPRVEPA